MTASGSQQESWAYGAPVNNIGSFFGGGGNSSPGGINYSTISTLTPQQQQFANLMQGNINQGTQPNNLYSGQQQQMAGALQNALTANPGASLSPENTAQYVNDSVATPLLRQYDQTIMPRLKDAYAAVGALMGSRRGLASQDALDSLQTTIASELGKAQLSNQQLSANLGEQTAQRQGNVVNQQQQNMLDYNRLAGQLTGQSWMAIQPYMNGQGQGQSGFNVNRTFQNAFSGGGLPQNSRQPQVTNNGGSDFYAKQSQQILNQTILQGLAAQQNQNQNPIAINYPTSYSSQTGWN